ncbi:ImuA family protein [Roseococcus sp. DSY-14]|uniref:ImuA family protein n=1 Tax=Roseococcus sp. DSY-14 TaxID=3369650 RepID=UPI00387B4A78
MRVAPPPLADLRARLERLERASPGQRPFAVLPFGHPGVDAALPGGGLPLGALHEVTGTGEEAEWGAAAALFVAGVLARLPGPVLWVLARHDLFAPGLAGAGLPPARLLHAEMGDERRVLPAMEEGLREPGLAGVVGEVTGAVPLTATRRLQLAAGRSGSMALLLRRARGGPEAAAAPSAALTRWRIAALPGAPPVPDAPEVEGLGRARWRLELWRVRGGAGGTWVVEACDAQGRLGVVPDIADRPAAPPPRRATG